MYNGGTTEQNSHSWGVLTQRYAYDFVQVDEQMERHVGAGTAVSDYFCYGEEIVAVADGTVVKVVDRVRTAPFVGYGIVDFLATNFVGNHLIIEHETAVYSLSAHLIKGSISVKEGERVQAGQVIGRCGHSGHSSEPHLHFHVQDRANFYFGMGLPIQFAGLEIDGKSVAQGSVEAGDFVRHG